MNHSKERADAARNRQAILNAALALFATTSDPATLTMSAVAEAAKVGKGTLFRRFGDRTSLIRAVFDVQVERLAQAIESGPSPLGPDTPPKERISAILGAIVDFKLENRALSQAVEAATTESGHHSRSPFISEGYSYIEELFKKLLKNWVPESEVTFTAHALLGAVRIDMLDYLSSQEGLSDEEIRQGLNSFVERVLRP